MDSDCKNIYHTTYLNSENLSKFGVVNVKFDNKTYFNNEKVCFYFRPVISTISDQYISINILNGKPMIRFLYINY